MESLIKEYINDAINNQFLEAMFEFIKIPNQSRLFDPEWKSNKLLNKVIELAKNFAISQEIENMTIEVLEEKNKTPALMLIIDPKYDRGTDSKSILIYGHLDKQPPISDQWTITDPYNPKLIENKLYGRGSADDGPSRTEPERR